MRTPRLLRSPVLAAGLAAWMSGCADASDDPFVSVMAEDTGGALELNIELPTPDDWIAETGNVGKEMLSDWNSSWDLPVVDGRGLRESTYPSLAGELASTLPAYRLDEGLDDLGEALDEAERVPSDQIPGRISENIDRARDAQLRGTLTLEQGQVEKAWTELLRGTDALTEVAPSQVAAELLLQADEGIRRLLATESYSEETRERAQSLIKVSRLAIQDQDFARAIRSAYYATLLLDPDREDPVGPVNPGGARPEEHR